MRIFICGDSTAASYNPAETRMVGWGQLLGDFLPGVTIVNLAMAGRSTRTFLAEGRLQPVGEAQRGDLVLIQFAHNDENEKKPERYAAPWTDFTENLRYFIRFAREKQAVPVLLTPICMRIWQDGKLQPTQPVYGKLPDRGIDGRGREQSPVHAFFPRRGSGEPGRDAGQRAYAAPRRRALRGGGGPGTEGPRVNPRPGMKEGRGEIPPRSPG